MKKVAAFLTLAALGAVSLPAQAATTFNFQFDQQGFVAGDGPLAGSIVGTGTFVSPIDLSAGLHNLTDLSGFTLNFSFLNGTSFSNANILTPLTGVAVNITDLGSGTQRLFFTESGGPGSDGGPNSGALDLSNVGGILSFEPSFAGGNFLYFNNNGYGRYVATSAAAVPEPATWAMMLAGFGAIGFSMRRRSKQQAQVGFAF